jgi:hypothetical protein
MTLSQHALQRMPRVEAYGMQPTVLEHYLVNKHIDVDCMLFLAKGNKQDLYAVCKHGMVITVLHQSRQQVAKCGLPIIQ